MKLHKEGKGSIFISALMFAGIYFASTYFFEPYSKLIIIPALILHLLVIWFFRVPKRKIREHIDNVIAPVDGKVVMIKEVEENEILKTKCIQVSIFMSPLNVHICRYPVSGRVCYTKYHKGKYLVAWNEKSSTENERTTIAVDTHTNHRVAFRQIAGYVARRIVMYSQVDDKAKAGHELGFIKFGSRMDIFLPLDTEIICKIGDKTKGGEDIIARLNMN